MPKKPSSIKRKKVIQKPKKLHPLRGFIIALLLIAWALYELNTQGDTLWFWFSIVLGAVIILPNSIWLVLKLGTPFGIPYFLSMLKTKRFVHTIVSLGNHANLLEKISIGGLFLGFGLAGIDYWTAREKGGWRRIAILFVGAIILGLVFWLSLTVLFAVPALAPLLYLGLISFILLGFGGLSLAFMLGYGYLSIEAFFLGNQICPSIAPVLPGVPIPGYGVMIPLIAWISLGIILIIHEFSHGIMLAKYKEKIKSVGLILVGIIPMGAFIEQDDTTFMKRNEKKQILVLSAGPSSNLVSIGGGLLLIFLLYFSISFIAPTINSEYEKTISGLEIDSVNENFSFCGADYNSPAYNVLFPGDKVLSINGKPAEDIIREGVAIEESFYLYRVMSNQPNENNEKVALQEFIIERDGNDYNISITPVSVEQFGISTIGAVKIAPIKSDYELAWWIVPLRIIINALDSILFFFILLSFAVGMFNFLPSDPLDGGRIAKFVLLPYIGFLGFNKKDGQKFIGRLFAWLFLISILVNLLPYITMFF
jgi:membrane-associated protease RseP (regulator of RpoE activity)